MIVKCESCNKYYDDQFRNTGCPHDTFMTNDGQNQFAKYDWDWLADYEPRRGFSDPMFEQGYQSEHDKYQEWLDANRIKR